jgi:hypothetical protein
MPGVKPALNMLKNVGKSIPYADKINSYATQFKNWYNDLYHQAVADVRGMFRPSITIGENMQRVGPAAEKLGSEVFKPSREGLSTQELMKENRSWYFDKLRKGYDVYDIGPDPNRATRSRFYEMESKASRRTGRPTIKVDLSEKG